MLAIKGSRETWQEWHVGDEWPVTTGRVLTIQADGHELTWLMDCIRLGREEATRKYYKETWGVME